MNVKAHVHEIDASVTTSAGRIELRTQSIEDVNKLIKLNPSDQGRLFKARWDGTNLILEHVEFAAGGPASVPPGEQRANAQPPSHPYPQFLAGGPASVPAAASTSNGQHVPAELVPPITNLELAPAPALAVDGVSLAAMQDIDLQTKAGELGVPWDPSVSRDTMVQRISEAQAKDAANA